MSPRDAARHGLADVGLACFLTAVTTAIGFGSLSFASHEVVREFGWSCVLGVGLAFVAVITSIPLLCSTWLGRRVHHGLERSLIDRNLNRIGGIIEFVLRRPRAIALISIATTGTLGLIALMLRPDERNSETLPMYAESVVALRKMDRALGGLEFGMVDVQWSEAVKPDSREVLEVVRKVDHLLHEERLIGHPLSIHNLLDTLPGDTAAADRMSMLELLPPPLKRAFYTPEHRQANVSFRVQDVGIAKYGPVFERIEEGLAEIERAHAEFDLRLSGSAVWRWENLYQIVVDLMKSLSTEALLIFVVLAVAYRSLRIGLISIVPNLFPLVLTASLLVATGQYLEMVSVCAFTICLAIAVDDTIHFLTRFGLERRHTDDDAEAIRRAFTAVGTGMIMTTIVLLAGFSTVLLSDSREHRIFAWIGVATLSSALFGDLVFLPALLRQFARPGSKQRGGSTSQRTPIGTIHLGTLNGLPQTENADGCSQKNR
jgi:predicted RND superfamily exporter protein